MAHGGSKVVSSVNSWSRGPGLNSNYFKTYFPKRTCHLKILSVPMHTQLKNWSKCGFKNLIKQNFLTKQSWAVLQQKLGSGIMNTDLNLVDYVTLLPTSTYHAVEGLSLILKSALTTTKIDWTDDKKRNKTRPEVNLSNSSSPEAVESFPIILDGHLTLFDCRCICCCCCRWCCYCCCRCCCRWLRWKLIFSDFFEPDVLPFSHLGLGPTFPRFFLLRKTSPSCSWSGLVVELSEVSVKPSSLWGESRGQGLKSWHEIWFCIHIFLT